MKNWIETFTGKRISPLTPHADAICIEDIARSLSYQCRFNGHCQKFYSVAEHSVHCARYAKTLSQNPKVPLFALLHDASEAYLCDIPRPIKTEFPHYLEWEERLAEIVFAKFAGRVPSREEAKLVVNADNTLLATEAAFLTVSKGATWELPDKPLQKWNIDCWNSETAEQQFLANFNELI